MSFEANQGQTGPQVGFLARGDGYSLFLTPTEAVLALKRPGKVGENRQPSAAVLKMQIVGGNASAPIVGEDGLPGKSNYFIGNDPSKWCTNIGKVQYRDVYPGIDLVYYGNQRDLEHDFIVAPGVDPKAIKLSFTGARRTSLARNGDLVLFTGEGAVTLKQPVLYQTIAGVKHSVQGHYQRQARSQVSFEVASYDHTQPLVIDPVLAYFHVFWWKTDAGWRLFRICHGSCSRFFRFGLHHRASVRCSACPKSHLLIKPERRG